MSKTTQKRYSLSKEEREKVTKLQDIADSLKLQHDGMLESIFVQLERVKHRLDLTRDVPKGYSRAITFDAKTFELVVHDTLEEVIEPEQAN